MVVLIPAYEPDDRLIELVTGLHAAGLIVVVVDDGSGPTFTQVFEAIGGHADVVRQDVNRGKGRALKTGFDHIASRYAGRDVVCADCDGQHLLADIVAVAVRLNAGNSLSAGAPPSDRIVLGVRSWAGSIPWKSRLGNRLTEQIFRVATGIRLGDTQTGLRAYPPHLLAWAQAVPGERFEYEMELLLAAYRDGVTLVQHPVDTVYLYGNESTHFEPLRDSARVYRPLLKFALRRGLRRASIHPLRTPRTLP